jgi:hypothetical protein
MIVSTLPSSGRRGYVRSLVVLSERVDGFESKVSPLGLDSAGFLGNGGGFGPGCPGYGCVFACPISPLAVSTFGAVPIGCVGAVPTFDCCPLFASDFPFSALRLMK